MRNLKKILAVALALAMTLSLMVTASAAFTDADKVDSAYAESVAVLNGLGVFKGYTDGSFNPQGDITRKEVAAIIYRITTGDVEDKQAALYAGSAQFADVPANEWYAGYVGFCANAGYVNGYEDGTFRPDNKVTGFEALAMVLRAIGYDAQNEFSGAKWQDNIAWVANNREITKDVKPGVLTKAASRELVAEILFETLLVDTVAYTPAFGYRTTGASLGYKMFDLVAFEGVLTANEYANLYGASAKSAGKSVIDDVQYNWSSDLTQLGLSYQGYAAGKDILFIEETGDNNVFETAEGVNISTATKFEDVTDMDDDAEYFVNFDNDAYDYNVSDWRIEYTVKLNKAALTEAEDAAIKANGGKLEADYTYTKAIRAGAKITALDMDLMAEIFAAADKNDDVVELGEVYVGTKSGEDVSDEMTWKQFKAEYLEAASDPTTTVGTTKNGNWLKVIDNDDDGDAEYVFYTEFKMAAIDDITRKGDEIKMDGEDAYFDMDDVVTADDLKEGDVVLYTVIDGNVYVDIAEVVVESINKKGISTKKETITCGETVYGQSEIAYELPSAKFFSKIVEAATETSYDLYLDHFGYVRMYTESKYDNGFVLLTDAYYETDKRDETYKAELWNEEYVEVEVVDGKAGTAKDADNFINSSTEKGDKEWDRLKEAGQVYFGYDAPVKDGKNNDPYLTNIAGYSVNDDGDYTLIKIGGESISNKTEYSVVEVVVDEDTGVKDKTLSAGKNIQTTTDTIYYFVLTKNGAIKEITTWVGYKNAPATAVLADGAKAYAVTTEGLGNYDVAEIVVFESTAANDSDLYFVYDYTKYDAITIGYDAETEAYDTEKYVEVKDTDKDGQIYDQVSMIDFYTIWTDGAVELIDKDYADEYIYAGRVLTANDVDERDYVKVQIAGKSAPKYFNEDETTVYTIGKTSSGYFYVEEAEYEIEKDDLLIILTNKSGTIQYVINVTQNADVDYVDAGEIEVFRLWKKIYDDATKAPTYTLTVNNYVEGVEYEINGGAVKSGDAVVAGDYTLTITKGEGVKDAVIYVGDDKTALTGTEGVYTVTVTDADVIVEITGDYAMKEFWLKEGENRNNDNAKATGLPKKVAYGTTVSFPVVADAGYSVTKVTANGVELTAVDGLYTVTVVATTVIDIETKANEYTVTFEYYDEAGKLIVSDTQETTVAADETKEVVLGKDAAYQYVVDGVIYAAGEYYTIEGVTEDTTVEVTVYAKGTVAAVEDAAALETALKDAKAGDTIYLAEGTYDEISVKEGVTLIGEEGVVFEDYLSSTMKDVTLKNIEIKNDNAQRWAYAKGTLVFENCTFDATSVYAIHYDGITGADVIYKNCVIRGWSAIAGGANSLAFDGCEFYGNGYYGLLRSYSDCTIENCTFDFEDVNSTDSYPDGIQAVGSTITITNCTNVNGDMEDLCHVANNGTITIDGVPYVAQ